MIRVLLIDDGPPARRVLRELLAAHDDIEIVAEAGDVASAITALKEKPDLVFLDIQLRGETGFDFLAQAPSPVPRIIFVTAYDRFAVRAFECNALDYLLKPIEPERLARALDRFRRRVNPPAESMTASDSVLLKDGTLSRFVPWAEILSVQSDGNYTLVTLANGSSLHVQRTLKEWLVLAPANSLLQIHRGTLVRRAAILEILALGPKKHELVLKNKTRHEISNTYWNQVRILVSEHT